MLIALLISLGVSALVIFLAATRWTPIIDEAIERLPLDGVIAEGRVQSPMTDPAILAEGSFFAVIYDPAFTEVFGQSADLNLEIGLTEVRIRCHIVYAPIPYQPDWVIPFNLNDLKPRWGAWKPFLLGFLGAGVFVSLWASWFALAILYSIPARMIAFYTRREAPGLTSWRLSLAALMPGAVLVGTVILVYTSHHIPLILVLVLWALHLPLGWFYLSMSPISLPLRGEKPEPFAPDAQLATRPPSPKDEPEEDPEDYDDPEDEEDDTPEPEPAPKPRKKRKPKSGNPFAEAKSKKGKSKSPFAEPQELDDDED